MNVLSIGCGYIGHRLIEKSKFKDKITASDYDVDKKDDVDILADYRDLRTDFLKQFTHIIWLAGHSSVPQSISDPAGCISNNLSGLIGLTEKYKNTLIYASSGSVYSGVDCEFCSEDSPLGTPYNIYDFTKTSFDNYQLLNKSAIVGLRFGTVVGAGKYMRDELLLNSMVKAAVNESIVRVANNSNYRPVLWIDDLIDAIDILLNSDPQKLSRVYNLYSTVNTMGGFAEAVSKKFSVPIKNMGNSQTYNFGMSNELFEKSFDYKFTSNINLILENIANFWKK